MGGMEVEGRYKLLPYLLLNGHSVRSGKRMMRKPKAVHNAAPAKRSSGWSGLPKRTTNPKAKADRAATSSK
jgi:hypothetical protein